MCQSKQGRQHGGSYFAIQCELPQGEGDIRATDVDERIDEDGLSWLLHDEELDLQESAVSMRGLLAPNQTRARAYRVAAKVVHRLAWVG
jgi:hypothetical protein